MRLAGLRQELRGTPHLAAQGSVIGIKGAVILARLPQAALGDVCRIATREGSECSAQVIAFNEDLISLAALDQLHGISPGAALYNTGKPLEIMVSRRCVGRVLDALGNTIDPAISSAPTASPAPAARSYPVTAAPPPPLSRLPVSELMTTGIRSLDGLCSLAYGQRVGLFAPAGVGKSTLLGMLARNAAVDVTVIALVAERGREVNEFINDVLGTQGLRRAVLVVCTSDESPLRRALAAYTATTLAEYFRDLGQRVLLLVDSLTRTARALREVGLAAGELPVRQGFTPSVYSELPRLLERTGNSRRGSITAIYTVLTAEEHDLDPLSDELKSLLDGHIVLNKAVADQGIRPAIDLTASISRLLTKLHLPQGLSQIQALLHVLARLKKDRDLLLFGGTPDKELQAALVLEPVLKAFLNQECHEVSSVEETCRQVTRLAHEWNRLKQDSTKKGTVTFSGE